MRIFFLLLMLPVTDSDINITEMPTRSKRASVNISTGNVETCDVRVFRIAAKGRQLGQRAARAGRRDQRTYARAAQADGGRARGDGGARGTTTGEYAAWTVAAAGRQSAAPPGRLSVSAAGCRFRTARALASQTFGRRHGRTVARRLFRGMPRHRSGASHVAAGLAPGPMQSADGAADAGADEPCRRCDRSGAIEGPGGHCRVGSRMDCASLGAATHRLAATAECRLPRAGDITAPGAAARPAAAGRGHDMLSFAIAKRRDGHGTACLRFQLARSPRHTRTEYRRCAESSSMSRRATSSRCWDPTVPARRR